MKYASLPASFQLQKEPYYCDQQALYQHHIGPATLGEKYSQQQFN